MAHIGEAVFLSGSMVSVIHSKQYLGYGVKHILWCGGKGDKTYFTSIEAKAKQTDVHPPMTNAREIDQRPLPDFPPSIWGSSFASFSFPQKEFESYSNQIEVLKSEVKTMLLDSSTTDTAKNIEFIDLLCRLGVSYHFENEIEMQLKNIFDTHPLEIDDCDLYTTSLLFRVLRQHGYKMPCSVFHKFKEVNGEFKQSIMNDVKGILSLYQASYLSVHGESILDEALGFSRPILEQNLASMQLSPHLEKHIKDTLVRPFHKGLPRIEARNYISFYQNEGSANETLLKFAKIDFNRVQLLHKQELSILSCWWRDSNFIEQLPYGRDRLVEVYFWANAILWEPQYDFSRIMITKYVLLLTLIDDTYDAYATFEELKHFSAAIDRWDIAATTQLPAHYMKFLFRVVIDLCKETDCEMTNKGRPYSAYFVREEFKDVIRSYHTEAQWSNSDYVPPFEEYVQNGLVSSAFGVIVALAFTGMEKVAGIKEYEWLWSKPKIAEAAKLIGCLMNDISGHEEEQKRGDCASSVECYMKEHNASKEQAIEVIKKLCANALKEINNECMASSATPMHILRLFTNIARGSDIMYETGDADAYTNPLRLKDHVTSIFMDKIPI